MTMKRDKDRYEFAKDAGAVYLYVCSKTGTIIGHTKYSEDPYHPQGTHWDDFEKMTIDEYEWMTDETRDRTVTTAADLYDSVEWTNKGFVINGEKININ